MREWIAPLNRFEQLRSRYVRLGDRISDLSYANPYAGPAPGVREALVEALGPGRTLDLQYAPFGGQALPRRLVADSLRRSSGLDYAAPDIVLTPGAMAALHLALRTVCAAGDEVIVPTPCWLDYPAYVEHTGMRVRLLPAQEPSFLPSAAAIEAALTDRTAAVLIANPGNPTGTAWSQAGLRELAIVLGAAEKRFGRRISIIADEAHRDYVPADMFAPAARAWPDTTTVYSFGKYHAMQGQRIGYAAVSPRHPRREEIARELVDWVRIAGFCTPTALMQRALPALLELDHDLGRPREWRRRFEEALTRAGFSVTPGSETLFLYVRVPGDRDDWEYTEELARAGVLVLPAPLFHHSGYFRLSMTGSDAMLEKALKTLPEHGA